MFMERAKKKFLVLVAAFAAGGLLFAFIPFRINGMVPGDIVDSLDGVYVYYNGNVGSTYGRNTAPDGYNIGLKYQCVEFVKRYYYEHYGHKMPDPYGHAVSFFDPELKDGETNTRRGLTQYANGGKTRPQKGDLLVYNATVFNPYGHVAIVAGIDEGTVTVIQQNPGPGGDSRETLGIRYKNGSWIVNNRRILGWLRNE